MSKTPANIHDKTFSALMSNREFAIGFYKTYLPAEVLERIDFSALEIFNVSGKVLKLMLPIQSRRWWRYAVMDALWAPNQARAVYAGASYTLSMW